MVTVQMKLGWKWCGAPKFGWKEGVGSQKIGRPILQRWSEDGVPVNKRRWVTNTLCALNLSA